MDSHSSALTNKELHFIQINIDSLAMTAANSLHLGAITAYFNALEHYYMTMESILPVDSIEKIEKAITQYKWALNLAETSDKHRGKKLLKYMLECTKLIYFNIRNGAQKGGQYYFRTGTQQRKGLSSVRNLTFSVHGGDKNKHKGKTDMGGTSGRSEGNDEGT